MRGTGNAQLHIKPLAWPRSTPAWNAGRNVSSMSCAVTTAGNDSRQLGPGQSPSRLSVGVQQPQGHTHTAIVAADKPYQIAGSAQPTHDATEASSEHAASKHSHAA